MSTVTCPKCNATVSDKLDTCPECGQALKELSTETSDTLYTVSEEQEAEVVTESPAEEIPEEEPNDLMTVIKRIRAESTGIKVAAVFRVIALVIFWIGFAAVYIVALAVGGLFTFLSSGEGIDITSFDFIKLIISSAAYPTFYSLAGIIFILLPFGIIERIALHVCIRKRGFDAAQTVSALDRVEYVMNDGNTKKDKMDLSAYNDAWFFFPISLGGRSAAGCIVWEIFSSIIAFLFIALLGLGALLMGFFTEIFAALTALIIPFVVAFIIVIVYGFIGKKRRARLLERWKNQI